LPSGKNSNLGIDFESQIEALPIRHLPRSASLYTVV